MADPRFVLNYPLSPLSPQTLCSCQHTDRSERPLHFDSCQAPIHTGKKCVPYHYMNDIHYRELSMPTSFEVQQTRPVIERAVVVIGAGPAGMRAAYTLKKAGKSVAVVEARNRVGGRTWNGRVADTSGNEHFIEIGGQWISPDQTR